MKLYCLSDHPNKPCNVVTFKSCSLMLDCALDMTTAAHFLPLSLVPSQKLNSLNTWMPRDADSLLEGELRECSNRVFVDSPPEFRPPTSGLIDFAEVDAILVSNYTSMLALPFITNGTFFKGVVFMTEPTLQIGRLFMEELVKYIERTPKAKCASRWKSYLKSLPAPLNEAKAACTWRQVYSMRAINAALSRVQIIAYNQKLDVCGALRVKAVSSGFCLGSCNWVIASDHEKIVYLSASSTLAVHPRPFDDQLMTLNGADVLIMTSLIHVPLYEPNKMKDRFCSDVVQAIRGGGNALVPCYPSGVVYDLFDTLAAHLDNVKLSFIPMYFISPVADSSLAYSNIFSEWLCSEKQDKVYHMEDPFSHSYLLKNNRLKAFKNLHSDSFSSEFKQPCIVFCGHPSLRFGDAVHFIEMWALNHQNVILFTEPEFDVGEALAPYHPLAMKVSHCPIDFSMDFKQGRKLVTEMNPRQVLVPESYLRPPVTAPHRTDLMLQLPMSPLSFSECQVVSIGLKRHFETAHMHSQLSSHIFPSYIHQDCFGSTITAKLLIKDNHFTLKTLDDNSTIDDKDEDRGVLPPKRYFYGGLCLSEVLHKIIQAGFVDAKTEDDGEGHKVVLEQENAVVRFQPNSSHILTNNSTLRIKLTDILLSCMKYF